uniref:Uncharacterized protein n=1 Tax=Arundo donax TaxID=35708 RepID=A0A0A8Z224_ARUDO
MIDSTLPHPLKTNNHYQVKQMHLPGASFMQQSG